MGGRYDPWTISRAEALRDRVHAATGTELCVRWIALTIDERVQTMCTIMGKTQAWVRDFMEQQGIPDMEQSLTNSIRDGLAMRSMLTPSESVSRAQ